MKLRNYGLSITLAVLFLASWAAQAIFQLAVEHESFGQFMVSTFENWQSEFLQLLTFVVLTSFLIHKGSHESKDGQDRMESKIDVLLRRPPNVVSVDISGKELSGEVARQLSQEIARALRTQGRGLR